MGSCISIELLDHSGNRSPIQASRVVEKADSSFLVASGECRMCYEKQIFDDDPVVQLGCMCLGDNSRAHESCIRKWFPRRLLESGCYDCEICRTQLGNHAISIVMQGIRSIVYQLMFRRGISLVFQAIGRIENRLACWFFPVLTQLSRPSERPFFTRLEMSLA